jgi:hypothetical protein
MLGGIFRRDLPKILKSLMWSFPSFYNRRHQSNTPPTPTLLNRLFPENHSSLSAAAHTLSSTWTEETLSASPIKLYQTPNQNQSYRAPNILADLLIKNHIFLNKPRVILRSRIPSFILLPKRNQKDRMYVHVQFMHSSQWRRSFRIRRRYILPLNSQGILVAEEGGGAKSSMTTHTLFCITYTVGVNSMMMEYISTSLTNLIQEPVLESLCFL